MTIQNLNIKKRAKRIKLLILDVDGVMTDGSIVYDNRGNELKIFYVRDGFGITLLHCAGIKTCIVTAKGSAAVLKRAKDLGMAKVYQSAHDKLEAYRKVRKEFRVRDEEVCFIGDDLIDLPILRRAGLSVAVKDAIDEVKNSSHYITHNVGGRGAVREVTELILKAQGLWETAVGRYDR